MTKLLFVVLAVLLTLVALHLISAISFKRFASGLMEQVAQGPEPVANTENIPVAILRFTQRAGVDPSALMRTVRLRQSAEMRLQRGGDWQPLTAEQVISTGASGFVWLAEQNIGPLVRFRVIDAYVAGVGRLNVRALGSIPVANSTGAQTDLGEAMRYLAELVWAPDAMLGNPALEWSEHQDGAVSVALKLPAEVARVQFEFNAEGDIVVVTAKDRPTEEKDGQIVLLDWRITVDEYRDFGARRVPARAEVGYDYPDGYEAYWRGEIISYGLEN